MKIWLFDFCAKSVMFTLSCIWRILDLFMGERLEMEWICLNKMDFFLFGGPHGREPSQSRINICCGCTPMFDGVFHCGRLGDIYIGILVKYGGWLTPSNKLWTKVAASCGPEQPFPGVNVRAHSHLIIGNKCMWINGLYVGNKRVCDVRSRSVHVSLKQRR